MKIEITVLLALTVGLGTTFATTTDELMLTAGGLTATISDNGVCVGTGCGVGGINGDFNPAAGTTTAGGLIGNWLVSITSGTSFSPSDVPAGLDLTSLTATCATVCATTPLDVEFSDINFSPANPSFLTQYSATITGGTGSTSESAYFSNSNVQFAETTLIGKVGPFTATNSGTAAGGSGSVAPYSLTLDQTFTSTTNALFSVDGSVSSVPEPGAVVLFGTLLAFCATKLRRRSAS